MAHDIKEALCILKPHGLSTVGSDTGWEDKAQCLHVCSTTGLCSAPSAGRRTRSSSTSQADHYKDSSVFSYSLVGGKLGAVVSFVLEAEDFQQIGDYSASSMGQVFKQF